MTKPQEPFVRGSDASELRWFFGNVGSVRVCTDECSIVEMRGATGDTPALHVHERDDEVFHVIEGELELHVGGSVLTVCAGQTGFAPRGIPHTYFVRSQPEARWLVVTPSSQFGQFFDAVSRPAPGPVLPPPSDGPPPPEAVERITRIAEQHGIQLLGPPGMIPSELAD